MVATKTIEVPFDAGYSQKTDALWLQPGASATAQNLVKLKQGSLAKSPGYTTLATAGQIPANTVTAGSPISVSLTKGRRLFSYNGALTICASDGLYDAIWSYDDDQGQPLLLDRLPGTHIYPPVLVAGCSPAPFATVPCARVMQVDTALANGYECHVWSVGDATGGSGVSIWYTVRNATTGAVVLPPQVLISAGTHGGIDVPKIISVGNIFVTTYASKASGDANIYARCMDATNVANGWSAESRINIANNDAAFATGIWNVAAYDIAASIGENGIMALLYAASIAATPVPSVVRLSVTTSTVTFVSEAGVVDSTWNADSKPVIQGFCVRADAGNNELAWAYSWTSATPVTRLAFGIVQWPSYTTVALSTDIIGAATGPITPGTINAAVIIAMERLGTINSIPSSYTVKWSPGQTTFRQGDAASTWPFIASYIVGNSSGNAVVANNQPRVTWNAALSSRVLYAPSQGICWVVAFVPSDTQGSHFILQDDSVTDYVTPNQTSSIGNGYFPMRLVGNLTPRQSNVQTMPSVSTPNQTMMGLTSPQFSRVQTHWCFNATYPGTNSSAWQTLVPKDNGPITSAPALYVVDPVSVLHYSAAQLGANVLLACGSPSAFDGSQCHEIGFPHAPVMKLTATGGSAPAGTWSYIALYRWTDATGQIHQSARSVPVAITLTGMAGSQGVSIVVAIPGFSNKMKAPNASQSFGGIGPQAGLPLRRPILVYLYRTTSPAANPAVYYQAHAPIPVNHLNPSVTFTDDFTLSGDANLIAQPLLYGDGSDGTQPGNILDDECPPAFQHLIVHQNRCYGIDGTNVWLSKEFTTFAGAGFNEATAFSVDDGPGNLTALASMDGQLVLFKPDRLFTMTGQGPADNGADNDLTPPARITSDAGCLDWRGVVPMAKGVYFMSQAGRRLLTRDLQVVPVPVVEDLDATYRTTSSALVHPSAGRVYWTQNTSDFANPRNGGAVLYDYVLETWSNELSPTSLGFVSATVANALVSGVVVPSYFALTSAGVIYLESATSWLFSGAFNVATWTSPWIKSDGLQGWSQWEWIRILLTVKDPANVTVNIFYDYSTSPGQTYTQTAAQLAAQPAPGPPQALLPIRPNNQRAAAMRIQIVDSSAASTATGQGFVLEDLRIDYGVEPGGYRAPVVQQG